MRDYRTCNSNGLMIMVLTVALLSLVGEVPESLAVIKWLMMGMGAAGVILSFKQPLQQWQMERIRDVQLPLVGSSNHIGSEKRSTLGFHGN